VSIDPAAIAADAGLRHAEVDDLTVRRVRCGRGFRYLRSDGAAVDAAAREWIEALAIPPAWSDVRIAPRRNLHLLAVGTDDAGRRQYRYHTEFRRTADEVKFARLGLFCDRLPDVRTGVERALAEDDPRDRLVALVVRLIDLTLLRVGTERYADENDSYGASTVRCEHATVRGNTVILEFRGKSGLECSRELVDESITRFVHRRIRRGRPDDALFVTDEGWGVDGSAVADRLSRWSRVEMTAKDLRTWGASAAMVEQLMLHQAAIDPAERLLRAFDAVADRLHNTRAVARESYVAPTVVEAWECGDLDRLWSTSRGSARRSRAESTLAKVLAH
jgi:DNA topoisomerase I